MAHFETDAGELIPAPFPRADERVEIPTLPVPPAEDITAEALAVYHERVARAVEDTLASILADRGIVAMRAGDSEVRLIARRAARFALGLSRRATQEAK